EAAAELGVSVATVYAYVSRGLLRSLPQPGSRRRLYRRDDLRALREGREVPADMASPLAPIESGITLLRGDAVFHRGRDLADLARRSSLEAVARLMWDIADPDPFALPPPVLPAAARPLREDPL